MKKLITAVALAPAVLAVVLHFEQLAANRVAVLEGFGLGALTAGVIITFASVLVAVVDTGEGGNEVMIPDERVKMVMVLTGFALLTAGSLSYAASAHY